MYPYYTSKSVLLNLSQTLADSYYTGSCALIHTNLTFPEHSRFIDDSSTTSGKPMVFPTLTKPSQSQVLLSWVWPGAMQFLGCFSLLQGRCRLCRFTEPPNSQALFSLPPGGFLLTMSFLLYRATQHTVKGKW